TSHYLSVALCSSVASHSLSILSSFLSFSRPHLHLHSFPTRRSSDLHGLARIPFNISTHAAIITNAKMINSEEGGRLVSTRPLTRSEEHTSELQSRFDLVCRLLLEKKKT